MTIKQVIKWKWITARYSVIDFFSKPIHKIARFFVNKNSKNDNKCGLLAMLASYSVSVYGSVVMAKGKIAAESTEFVNALEW